MAIKIHRCGIKRHTWWPGCSRCVSHGSDGAGEGSCRQQAAECVPHSHRRLWASAPGGFTCFLLCAVQTAVNPHTSLTVYFVLFYFTFLRFYLFLERGKVGRKRGRETSIGCIWYVPRPTGNLAGNPGMCPDWESNQWPFTLQVNAQSTEPHRSGQFILF